MDTGISIPYKTAVEPSLQEFFERSWKKGKPSKLLFCARQKLGRSERVDVGIHILAAVLRHMIA